MADGPIVFEKDNITYYRASALGLCPTAFIHFRNGHEAKYPKPLLEAFKYGTDNEEIVINLLKQQGWNVHDAGLFQRTISLPLSPTLSVQGHPDGIATALNGIEQPTTLVEVKCLSSDNVAKFKDDWKRHFPYYAWQVTAYYHGLNHTIIDEWNQVKQILFAIYDKGTRELWTQIEKVPYSLFQLKNHVTRINDKWVLYRKNDEYPPCIFTSFCPFFYLHADYQEEPIINAPSLYPLLLTHQALTTKIELLSATKKDMDNRIKSIMDLQPEASGKVIGSKSSFKISYKPVVSTRLKTREVKKYLTEQHVIDDYLDTLTTMRLDINATEELA